MRHVDDEVVVLLGPDRFARARFERVGHFAGGEVPHAFGAGDGWFEWRFPAPPARAGAIEIKLRLSSEFPGSQAPPDGGSHALVLIDGVQVAALEVIPDDGRGQLYTVVVTNRALLDRLRGGHHTLKLSVPPGPHSNGLCVYGVHGPPPAHDAALPLELRFRPSAPSRGATGKIESSFQQPEHAVLP